MYGLLYYRKELHCTYLNSDATEGLGLHWLPYHESVLVSGTGHSVETGIICRESVLVRVMSPVLLGTTRPSVA
jgi:hypothetical protein